MSTTPASSSKKSISVKQVLPLLYALGGIGLGAGGMYWLNRGLSPLETASSESEPSETGDPGKTSDSAELSFPKDRQEKSGLKLATASKTPFESKVVLTGKIALNEDRVAHIFPQIDGVVDQVKIQFGQPVKKGDELIVIRSREIGQAKLELYQDRMLLQFAESKNQWTEEVTRNTNELIAAIRKNPPIEQLETQFRERTMGDYREKLMTSYVNLYRSKMDLERLSSLTESNAVPAKQRMAAVAAVNADQAILQASLEQIEQDVKRGALLATQALREAQVKVSVAEANFNILGLSGLELEDIEPSKQGEALSFYPIRAPFDGTVIEKDVVLLERALPDRRILTIADLSSVWVEADIYEEHLSLLKELNGKQLQFRSAAFPDQIFQAEIFFQGEIVEESSRTISMVARAENPDGLLKPGMFVNVELPSLLTTPVLQVPPSAVLDYQGENFVFVSTGPESFARHNVKIGRRSEIAFEILEGIQAGDQVVTEGGFALKSLMLAELIAGE
jgi:cobalt-zinc-cadmium efflux system membrane fusion protein